MKNKKKTIAIVIMVVVLAAIAALIGCVIYTKPIYPAFQKTVRSLDELRSGLKDKQDIIVPDASELGFEEGGAVYMLRLDGRFRNSKPVGYLIDELSFADEVKDYKCDCFIRCQRETEHTPRNDKPYNGVNVSEYVQELAAARSISYYFNIDGYEYEMDCIFSTGKILSEEQARAAQQEVQDKLYAAVCKLIDLKNN